MKTLVYKLGDIVQILVDHKPRFGVIWKSDIDDVCAWDHIIDLDCNMVNIKEHQIIKHLIRNDVIDFDSDPTMIGNIFNGNSRIIYLNCISNSAKSNRHDLTILSCIYKYLHDHKGWALEKDMYRIIDLIENKNLRSSK